VLASEAALVLVFGTFFTWRFGAEAMVWTIVAVNCAFGFWLHPMTIIRHFKGIRAATER
jgi:hypothetical protein